MNYGVYEKFLNNSSYFIEKPYELVHSFCFKTFSIDFQIISYLLDFNPITNNFDIGISFIKDYSSLDNDFKLFNSVILDIFYKNNVFFKSFYSNNWFKNSLSESNTSMGFFLVYHPEAVFFIESFKKNFELKNYVAEYEYINVESIISPSLQIIDFFSVFFLITLIISFYFSYYTLYFSEDTAVDSDYLSSSIMVESEKELSSLEDILLTSIIIIHLFGWFFYINSWIILGSYPELILMFYLLPFLAYLVFGMPSVLLIDFGNYFLMFIRGCGTYTSLTAELMYDYINIGAFYVRLSVQWVRLLIMYLTFVIMHDTLAFFLFPENMFLGSMDYLWEDSSNLLVSAVSITYTFVISLYSSLFRLLFELAHTIFVCTAQFIAFFAISFWFFLFLYTFFTSIKLEAYFNFKRNLRSKEELKKKL